MTHLLKTFGAVVVLAGGTASAAVTDDASLLLRFDHADSGQVASGSEIVDSSSFSRTPTAVVQAGSSNPASLNWGTTPDRGPGGALTQAPQPDGHGRGLAFNPTVESAGDPTTYNSAGFEYNGFSVTGSSTFATRFKWDGLVSDMAWLYGNGHGASKGWLIGIQNMGGEHRIGQFQHQNGGMRTPGNFVIDPGKWYDLVFVMQDDAEEGAGVDKLTLYLIEEGGSLQIGTLETVVNSTSGTKTIVGSEALGTGTGNNRKAWAGTVDYIGVWDRALSEAEVQTLLIPEPTGLSALSLAAFGLLRRRSNGI